MNKPLSDAMHYAQHTLTKVPEITVYFWIIKVLTTGMGEVTSDYPAHQINPIIAAALDWVGKLGLNNYNPWPCLLHGSLPQGC